MSELQKLSSSEQQAREFGFDWPDPFMILDQIIDECREIREELEKSSNKEKLQEEIGDLLLATISLCLFANFEVTATLEKTNFKFSKRLKLLKELTWQYGLENLNGQSLEFKLDLWKKVKIMANI